jgi:hypothetical protein
MTMMEMEGMKVSEIGDRLLCPVFTLSFTTGLTEEDQGPAPPTPLIPLHALT